MDKLKIYWMSNSPTIGSGYGVQTAMFCTRLKAAGHDVVIRGNFGHNGNVFRWNDIPVLPSWFDGHGVGVMPLDIERHQPDVAVCLYDVWVFPSHELAGVTAYAPIDHDPIPPQVADRLQATRHQWAMSRFAEREMRRVGLSPSYVPHAVETDVYQPVDRLASRRAWNVDENNFFAVMIAANKGYPSRKSIDRVLEAWAQFVRTVDPKAVLYIHTNPHEIHHGIDVFECARRVGVPEDNLKLPDLYSMNLGQYDAPRMNLLLNAADVLIAPSHGEGFGVPVIEAQAAGCPVIVSDFTAQAELCGAGWKVVIDDDDQYYSLQNSYYANPRTSRIYEAMRAAHVAKDDLKLRDQAREFAMGYDADAVFEKYLMPALVEQVERERDLRQKRDARTAQRLAMRVKPEQKIAGPKEEIADLPMVEPVGELEPA